MAKQIGDGASLTMSGFTMELTSITWTGASRGFSDSSTLSTTTWRTKIVHSLTDPGGFDIEGAYDATLTPPLTAAATACTLAFGDGCSVAFSGFMTDFQCTAALGELNTFTAHIEGTGTVTFDTTPT